MCFKPCFYLKLHSRNGGNKLFFFIKNWLKEDERRRRRSKFVGWMYREHVDNKRVSMRRLYVCLLFLGLIAVLIL